ncbi:MAG: hypothetical protein KA885_12285 [Spirochaetes bacterium]|nr:hypothetical protein [Spirochaetota bacterium]
MKKYQRSDILYNKIYQESEICFSVVVKMRNSDPLRSIPNDKLIEALNRSDSIITDDPKGSIAKMFYNTIELNGQKYNLEVLFNISSSEIWHYLYTRDKRLNIMPKIFKGEKGGNIK